MTRLVAFLTGAVLSLSIATPRGQAVREWPTYPIKQAPAALQPAIQHGDLVIISIQNATSSELTRALDRRRAWRCHQGVPSLGDDAHPAHRA